MKFKAGDRVGLSATTYTGPINLCNPVWDSFMGRIGGTVTSSLADECVAVDWDNPAPLQIYLARCLFGLTAGENIDALAWTKHQLEDPRTLFYLAFGPDQMFHLAIDFHMEVEDRTADVNSPYLLIVYDEPLPSFTSDDKLMNHMIDNQHLLLGFNTRTHFNSLCRFHHINGLPEPRAVPRVVYDVGAITTAMRAVPESDYQRARAVFTCAAHEEVVAGDRSAYELLVAYLDMVKLDCALITARQAQGEGATEARTILA